MALLNADSVPLFAASLLADPKADNVTASCTIEPQQVERGSQVRLRVRMNAVDSRKHLLAYVWSANGGIIAGTGPEVMVDSSGLAPGRYGLAGAVQDAYRNRAECTVEFLVLSPPEALAAKCSSLQAEVAAGMPARFTVETSGGSVRPLRIQWFSNGGTIRGGAEAEMDTAGLMPADYSVTARVEDDAGRAADCQAMVRVIAPPPPPPAPELINLTQIVFPRNVGFLAAADAAKLEAVVLKLQTDSAGTISVESYAGPDERDTQRLAEARAASVKQFLLGQGVAEPRIRVQVGLGGRLGGVRNRTLDIVWVPEGFDY